MSETPQQALARLARERGTSLSALSRMLGRNVAYLGQFVTRGSPRTLPERERALLADFLGADETLLGAPPREAVAQLPYLTVAASAGPGAATAAERVIRQEPFARAALRAAGIAPETASLIRVVGDSMEPGLRNGDRLLVDRNDRRVPGAGGVFVIREGDALSVKRLLPSPGGWEIRSDNPAYETRRCGAEELTVIGRARLLVRDL